jgi:hypothetical protein
VLAVSFGCFIQGTTVTFPAVFVPAFVAEGLTNQTETTVTSSSNDSSFFPSQLPFEVDKDDAKLLGGLKTFMLKLNLIVFRKSVLFKKKYFWCFSERVQLWHVGREPPQWPVGFYHRPERSSTVGHLALLCLVLLVAAGGAVSLDGAFKVHHGSNIKGVTLTLYCFFSNFSRFLMGFGLGFSITLSTLYIMEVTTPDKRGQLAVVPAIAGALGGIPEN